MNCVYENYLYIYNIKLIEENTLLIKKKTFKHENYFYIYNIKLIQFFFSLKTQKTVFHNSFQKQQPSRP